MGATHTRRGWLLRLEDRGAAVPDGSGWGRPRRLEPICGPGQGPGHPSWKRRYSAPGGSASSASGGVRANRVCRQRWASRSAPPPPNRWQVGAAGAAARVEAKVWLAPGLRAPAVAACRRERRPSGPGGADWWKQPVNRQEAVANEHPAADAEMEVAPPLMPSRAVFGPLHATVTAAPSCDWDANGGWGSATAGPAGPVPGGEPGWNGWQQTAASPPERPQAAPGGWRPSCRVGAG